MANVPIQDGDHFYKRISIELSHSWPGEVYLRFEPFMGPAIMVRVLPGDIISLSDIVPLRLDTEQRISRIARARHPDMIRDRLEEMEPADDDFQPGDSG